MGGLVKTALGLTGFGFGGAFSRGAGFSVGLVVVFATGFVVVFVGGLEAGFGVAFVAAVLLFLVALVAVMVGFLAAVSGAMFCDLFAEGSLTAAFWAVLDLFAAVALPLFLDAIAAVGFDTAAACCFAAVSFAIHSDLLGAGPLTEAF